MPNGRIHDHPVTDTVVYGLHPFPPDLEELVVQVHARGPGIFNDLGVAPFDWERGRWLAQARRLLSGLIEHHGDSAARRRLLREYTAATSHETGDSVGVKANVSLEEIGSRMAELAATVGAPADALPTFGQTEDGARPHVEVAGPLMHYVVVERGEELLRETFASLDALLGRVFQDVTNEMAGAFELRNRRPNEDSRRQFFAKQLEYLAVLNAGWAERQRAHLNEVLREHPFTDGLEPRDRL